MLSFLPTPIGNLDDLSFRALEKLREAEIFFCEDTRVTKKLLFLLQSRFDVRFCESARFIAMHSHNERMLVESLNSALLAKRCVYVSDAGMPCVSDPGAALVAFCVEHSVDYEVLPGANAAITAFAASGIESAGFLFHGFLPHKSLERKGVLTKLLQSETAVIIYESPRRITGFARLLRELEPDRRLFAVKELTKLYEKRFFGTAEQFAVTLDQLNLKGEWTIVIDRRQRAKRDQNEWLIEELLKLDAPVKPLSKILSRLTDERASLWYERLKPPQ
ncbi:MAG: 16S rRNA (cytidine(1402)-2'-O)-methyltransferase [Helicobacteraceae bacterium]|nr:16S rRNA (cytidine(1402)-2'-O)-methyltransferase [Helicobacteraceae bacterium]